MRVIRLGVWVSLAIWFAARAGAGQAPTAAPAPAAVVPADVERNVGNFVQIVGPRALVHCGEMELTLDGDRAFSMAAASKLADAARTLLTSTTLKLWLNGQEQTVWTVGQVANLILVEEGPQRIVLRGPFTLTDQAGQPRANAQFDFVCYPEGEIFATLRVLPLHAENLDMAVSLRFARDPALRFERSYDLPLVTASLEGGPAIGLYWHDGAPPQLELVGGQMRGTLPCRLEFVGETPMFSRSFVISLARDRDELRRRCKAHVQPLRPFRIEACRPLVEQAADSSGVLAGLTGWSYSFREGTYNFLADGPQATVEFHNPNDEGRRVRLRFVTGVYPALTITRYDAVPCDALQVVSTTPEFGPGQPNHVSAVLAAFELPGRECLQARAARADQLLLQWVSARVTKEGITRLYRLVTGEPVRLLGEVRIADGGAAAGVELTSLASPLATSAPAVAALAAMPPAGGWGRFSRMSELAVVRNQPDRVVLHFVASNEAGSLSCRSDLVFRREGGLVSLYGYHTFEAITAARISRATSLELPRIRINQGKSASTPPLRFFYADLKKQIGICQRTTKAGFGYDLGAFNRSVNPSFGLCGFMGGTSAGLALLAKPVVGTGRLSATAASPILSMNLDLPASVARGQRFESMWKLVIPGSGETNLRMLQLALDSIKGDPVDLEYAGNRFTVGDGAIAHRVYELSPAGNPASNDGWCYLLDGGSELAIVGAGADTQRWPWMFRIRALGFDPARVRKILLSHAGAEHAGGGRALRQLTGAAIHLHASGAEALAVAGPDQDQRTGALGPCRTGRFDSVGVDRPLRDKEVVTVGALQLRFLHTPGPSGESGTYLATVGGLTMAFGGELFSPGQNGDHPTGGRADAHPHGNLNQWASSLRLIHSLGPDLAASDHLAPVTGTDEVKALCARGIERIRNVLAWENVDYLLPRPLVVERSVEPREESTASQTDLWGVKELERSPFLRTQALLLADGLWRVGGGFSGEDEDANVYLVDGGSELALIGAGSGLHTPAIINRVLSIGKNPLNIKYILLPSNHWYEARGAASLRAATEAHVCAHRYEAGAMWRGDVMRTGLMTGDFLFSGFSPCHVDRVLEWGEALRVGSREIVVLDAPGFHRGSTAFLFEMGGARYLATGQAALGDLPTPEGGTVTGAVGWLDPHWGGCVPVWRETLQRFIALRPNILLPGQGPMEEDDAVGRLRDCLARLDAIGKLPGVAAVFPPSLLDSTAKPQRANITPLTARK